MSLPQNTNDTRFFGHPRGLGVLAGTELWERFSFFGMQGLLMLYMTQHLFDPGRAPDVWGLSALRSALEATTGRMTDLAFAIQTYGLYAGLVFVAPLAGSWLGDRVLGRTRTISLGACLMAAGHMAMIAEQLFLAALALLIAGAGCLIGNMSAQLGQLYSRTDALRAQAFNIYLIVLNVAGMAAPLVCGTLGEKVGWEWGFGAAAIGMLIGLGTYLAGRRYLPADRLVRARARTPLGSNDWTRVRAILLALAPYVLMLTAMNQAGGVVLAWAAKAVDRKIGGWDVPITWILAFDGAMTIVGVLLANAAWRWLGARRREPGDLAKLGIGCAGVSAGYMILAAGAGLPGPVPVLVLVSFFLVLDLASGWLEAPVASFVTKTAPDAITSTMIAVMKLAVGIGYFLLGWMGRFLEPLGAPLYWALTSAIAATGALLALALGGLVARMGASGDQPAPGA